VRFEIMAEVVDDTLCGGAAATTTACNNVAQEEKANFLITSEYAGTSLLSKSLMLLLFQARFFLSFFLSLFPGLDNEIRSEENPKLGERNFVSVTIMLVIT
jgi:hypothetical protein